MAEPFLGELRCFGFTFPPSGWAECNGQILSIAQNTALFSLFGTIYGGDGETTFGLPELRGRAPIHHGQGPGLPNFPQGDRSGNTETFLTTQNLPAHSHDAMLFAQTENADSVNPTASMVATTREDTYSTMIDRDNQIALHPDSISVANTGGGTSFSNMPPYLALTWCVALVGIFPSQ